MFPRLLSALRLADLAAIIEAAEARARENKAWLSKHRETGRRLTAVSFNAMALDRTPHPEHKRLCRLVEALSPNARHQLMAVMWVGRGDESPDRFAAAVAYARDYPVSGVAYICGKAPLAKYLRAGVTKLGVLVHRSPG
jgi:hypothetical protein